MLQVLALLLAASTFVAPADASLGVAIVPPVPPRACSREPVLSVVPPPRGPVKGPSTSTPPRPNAADCGTTVGKSCCFFSSSESSVRTAVCRVGSCDLSSQTCEGTTCTLPSTQSSPELCTLVY